MRSFVEEELGSLWFFMCYVVNKSIYETVSTIIMQNDFAPLSNGSGPILISKILPDRT